MPTLVSVETTGGIGIDGCRLAIFNVEPDECAYLRGEFDGTETGTWALGRNKDGQAVVNLGRLVRSSLPVIPCFNDLGDGDDYMAYGGTIFSFGSVVDGDYVQQGVLGGLDGYFINTHTDDKDGYSGSSVSSKYYCPILDSLRVDLCAFSGVLGVSYSSGESFYVTNFFGQSAESIAPNGETVEAIATAGKSFKLIPYQASGGGGCVDEDTICCESFYFLNRHNVWEYVMSECKSSSTGSNESFEYCANECDNHLTPYAGRGKISFSATFPVPNYNKEQFSFAESMAMSPQAVWYDSECDKWRKGKFVSVTLTNGEDGELTWESIEENLY